MFSKETLVRAALIYIVTFVVTILVVFLVASAVTDGHYWESSTKMPIMIPWIPAFGFALVASCGFLADELR